MRAELITPAIQGFDAVVVRTFDFGLKSHLYSFARL